MIETIKAYALLIKIAAAVLLVIAAVWWWNSHNAAQQQIGYDRAANEYDVKLAEAKDAARTIEQGWFLKYERASNENAERQKKLRIERAAFAATADGLRRTTDDLRQRLSVATVEACRSTADACLTVFGECSAELGRVAEAADGHAADAEQCLSAWPG